MSYVNRWVLMLVLVVVLGMGLLPGCSQGGAKPDSIAAHLADVNLPGWTPVELEVAMAYLDDRGAWEDHGRPLSVPKHPAEKYLDGWLIVLDPGHGGKGDVPGYKVGPTGVREAEMNLRVAFLLRKLLEDAGAYVTLTREGEVSEAADDRLKDTHQRRADIANHLERPDGGIGADLFISLHHNASSRPGANYPSIWFHGEADWAEPSLDAARYVGHRIGAELRCYEVGLTSVLMSDQQMYANGFAVLRHARVPAFLTESSFFTDPNEEQRLRDAVYNLREAYAIYTGLVEYAYGGRPTQTTPQIILTDRDTPLGAGYQTKLVIQTTLDEDLPDWWGHDRLRILTSTLAVFLNGQRLVTEFDPTRKNLTAAWSPADGDSVLEKIGPGPHTLSIHHANMYKHHNWPQRYTVTFDEQGVAAVTPGGQPYAGEAVPPAPTPAAWE